MSDSQRNQKPTPKRVREFRKRGEVALSRDVVSAATFAGGAIALVACAGTALAQLRSFTRDAALAADGSETMDFGSAAIRTFATVATPVLVGALVGALLAIGTQLGWPPALRGLKVDFSRISPFTNLKQTFAPTAMMRRSGAALAKLAVVGTVVVLALSKGMSIHPTTANGLAAAASSAITRVLGLVVGAIATIAAVDYVLARRRMTAKMKMTPDEVKREMREQDGDPQLKGRRRAKMKELAKRRIAAAVAKADVVVVNPTHYAVALRYDDQQDRAPVVVAKGVDETAEKIRELARKHGVPVLERPPLARALHKLVKEGQPIPSKLYRAVAEVLAYVYRLRARTGAARGGRR